MSNTVTILKKDVLLIKTYSAEVARDSYFILPIDSIITFYDNFGDLTTIVMKDPLLESEHSKTYELNISGITADEFCYFVRSATLVNETSLSEELSLELLAKS